MNLQPRTRWQCAIALCATIHACATVPQPRDPLDGVLASTEARLAQSLAPDLFLRAERAHRAALATSDQELRTFHAARARSWLDASIAEAQRIEAQRATSAAEARVAAAEARRVRAVLALAEVQAAEARRQAAEAQSALAHRMWAEGALGAATRSKDGPVLEAAIDFLRDRTVLILAAARVLGVDAEVARKVEAELDVAAALSPLRLRLPALRLVLAAAEGALGAARRARPGPSVEERASLLDAATERGLAFEVRADGVALLLPNLFAPGRAELSVEGQRQLEHLAALLRAHPHGEARLEALAPDTASPAQRKLAARRAAHLTFIAGSDRLRLAPSTSPGAVSLALPAYK